MKKNKNKMDDLDYQIAESEEGDLIDEIVDNYSYFYDEKPKKKDKWYSVLLNTRNVVIGIVVFLIGSTCLGYYANSKYFSNKEKTYLTPALRKEIYFWDTTKDAMKFIQDKQGDVKYLIQSVKQNEDKLTYTIPQDALNKAHKLFNEARGIYNNLTRIEYCPPNVGDYTKEGFEKSLDYLNNLKIFYCLESSEFLDGNQYKCKGDNGNGIYGPIYEAITKPQIVEMDYKKITNRWTMHQEHFKELQNQRLNIQEYTNYKYSEKDK